MDAMFLWMEHRRQPMHVAGLQLYTPPPGAGPDFVQELVEKFRKHTEAKSPFNLRPVFKLGHWFWEEDEDFELDWHLRHSALPRPGRIRELLALVSRLHGTLMDRSRPLWEMNIIEGLADGRVAVYVKLHHAMFDGVAATKMLQNTLSEDPHEDKPPPWAQTPRRREAKAVTAPAAARKLLQPLFDAVKVGRDIAPGIRSGLWEIVRSSQSNPADPRTADHVQRQDFRLAPLRRAVLLTGAAEEAEQEARRHHQRRQPGDLRRGAAQIPASA